jgi:Flp pilus assembly protein TadG
MIWRKGRKPDRAENVTGETPRGGLLRRLWRDTRGSAALEFAMIAPWFFMILFSMFEVGITYSADAMLQNAVTNAARQIRTGEVELAGENANPNAFRQRVCAGLTVLIACDNNLKIEVRPFSNAGNSACTSPRQGDGSFRPTFAYNPGTAGDFILVCAYYKWDTFTPGLGSAMSATPGGFMLQANAAVRNEPYKPTALP